MWLEQNKQEEACEERRAEGRRADEMGPRRPHQNLRL